MKQLFSSLVLLLLTQLLAAQIGKEYANLKHNGQLERIITYNFDETEQTEDGTYVGVGYPTKIITTYKDGYPSLLEYELRWGKSGEYSRSSKSEIDWKDGLIMEVREYSDTESRGGSLFKRYLPLYHEGEIVAENILYGKNELRASLVYAHPPAPEGVTIVDMTMYKPDMDGPQGHYYIEEDKWGMRIHIESVGKDTGRYQRRIQMVGDSIFESLNIASSRRNRGSKDTALVRSTMRYDAYENPTYVLTEIEKKSGEPAPIYRMLTISEYDYVGDEKSTDRPLTVDALKRKWVNKEHDLALNIGRDPNNPNRGIYSISSLTGDDELDVGIMIDEDDRIIEDRVMESGDAWIIALVESGIGEWIYEADTQTLTFQQRDHLVAQVKVSMDLFSLLLSPIGNHRLRNDLLLRKG